MEQLNHNSVRKIASMLPPQNRKKLPLLSRELSGAFRTPPVSLRSALNRLVTPAFEMNPFDGAKGTGKRGRNDNAPPYTGTIPVRKRKRGISSVRNTGRLQNHPKFKQIRNKYREILLRGNLENESYEGLTTNNIAKIIDRELFHGVSTVARTNSMKVDFQNMMLKENRNHAKKLRYGFYDSRGIRRLFTPIGKSLNTRYQKSQEDKIKRGLNGLHPPWHVRLTRGHIPTYLLVWNVIRKILSTQNWRTTTRSSILSAIASYFGEEWPQAVSVKAKAIVDEMISSYPNFYLEYMGQVISLSNKN